MLHIFSLSHIQQQAMRTFLLCDLVGIGESQKRHFSYASCPFVGHQQACFSRAQFFPRRPLNDVLRLTVFVPGTERIYPKKRKVCARHGLLMSIVVHEVLIKPLGSGNIALMTCCSAWLARWPSAASGRRGRIVSGRSTRQYEALPEKEMHDSPRHAAS